MMEFARGGLSISFGESGSPFSFHAHSREKDMTTSKSDFIGVSEIASIVGVSPTTVRIFCKYGEIDGAQQLSGWQWMAPRAAVEAFARSRRSPVAA